MSAINRFEADARATKVRGLLFALDAFAAHRGSPVLAAELLGWSDESWALLACIARVTNPSVKTRSAVRARLAETEAGNVVALRAVR